jgi:hypothetical protein
LGRKKKKKKNLKIENVTAFLIDFISEGNQRRSSSFLFFVGLLAMYWHEHTWVFLSKVDNFHFLQNWMKRTRQLCCCCCRGSSSNEHFSRIVLCKKSKLLGPFRAMILVGTMPKAIVEW